MRAYVRLGAALTAAALTGAAVVLAFAPAAHAATLTVTTPDDVVDGTDGVLSLREAISDANAAGEASTIVLTAGTTYELDLCGGATEDLNATGDLDHVADQDLTIEGNGATIEQTCAGERVLHTTSATATVTLDALTLTGGEGYGAAVQYTNDLALTGVTVSGNDTLVLSDAVLASDPGMSGSITLTGSTVGPNAGRGLGGAAGTAATITDSTITGNTGSGVDITDGLLSVSGSVVSDNGGHGLRTTGQGSGLFPIVDTLVSGNDGTGVICSACGDLQITGSEIRDNDDGGITWSVDQDSPTDEATITITSSDVLDNTRDGAGAGLSVQITELEMNPPLAQIVVDASTFAGNQATGVAGTGGAIDATTGEVRVTNSTIVANTASVSGGGISSVDGIYLQHVTMTANAAPTGSQISTTATLDSFGSIVSAGAGGSECVVGGTLSGGYNVGGDGTCGFTGTGDQNTAGALSLGPLQDNGGPTLTLLPLAGSPALGAVPASACTVSTVDQRGVARPQGAACEAGAVEVDERGLADTGTSLTGVIVAGVALLLVGGLILALLARRRPMR